jgi:hypothetical protein
MNATGTGPDHCTCMIAKAVPVAIALTSLAATLFAVVACS